MSQNLTPPQHSCSHKTTSRSYQCTAQTSKASSGTRQYPLHNRPLENLSNKSSNSCWHQSCKPRHSGKAESRKSWPSATAGWRTSAGLEEKGRWMNVNRTWTWNSRSNSSQNQARTTLSLGAKHGPDEKRDVE